MDGSTVKITPRPMAPGRVRRRLASNPTPVHASPLPPPPYAASASPRLDTLLGSPVIMTAQMMEYFGAQAPGSPAGPPPKPEQWMNERSQGELRDLLSKAEQTIKEREEELSWTSAVCKSLYSNNSLLKTKHEALVSRLPISPSPTSSFLPSPSPSPLHHTTSLPITSASEPDLANSSFSGTTRKRSYRHARRVSVTPAELAQLSDQNSELLNKLQALEGEAADADRAGKRKLKKLEREIQGLREELDRTQARSADFERKARRLTLDMSGEAQIARRKEREERVRVLRHRVESEVHLDGLPSMKDFAPGGAIGKAVTPRRSLNKRYTSPIVPQTPASTLPLKEQEEVGTLEQGEVSPDLGASSQFRFPGAPSPLSASSRTRSSSLGPEESSETHQYSVISQLLAKIQELEEANTQIVSQQRETGERLQAAQRDSESIRRLYDYLGDDADVDLQIILEDADQPSPVPDAEASPGPSGSSPTKPKTIRFKSLKRTIQGDLSRLTVLEEDPFFAKGIHQDMQSTAPRVSKNGGPSKPRKTVAGLFSPPEPDVDTLSELSLDIPAIGEDLDTPASSAAPSPMPMTLLLETASNDSIMLNSLPVPSPLSGIGAPLHTLGSELGSDFDSLSGENHHLRSTSLADIAHFALSQLSADEPPSPCPPGALPLTDDTSTYTSTVSSSARRESSSSSTPTNSRIVSANLEVPVGPQTLRNRRLSQTVRARRGRWAEGRFGLQIDASHRATRSLASTSSSPTPTATNFTFMSAFDAVADKVAGRRLTDPELDVDMDLSSDVFDSSFEDNEEANESALSIRAPLGPIVEQRSKKSMIEVVMELYLWIQFLLVILVFVYTMAKRGPRVLAETEKRRGHVRASTRG